MKQIIFTKQGMKNFCNHIDPVELEFGSGKLLMVTGPNGSGKTSMFQALPYTLFGVCEKGRGEEVLNNKIKKNCHTWTEFTVIDGNSVDMYRVDRYVKYTKKGNTVILEKNGTPIAKGHKEVVPMIERIIVPYKLFTNTLLFGQKVKTFFTDLTDSEQKEIFRKIIKLGDWVLFQQTTSNKRKEVKSELEEVLREIAIKEGLIDSNKQELEMTLKRKELFYQDKEIKLKELKGQRIPFQTELASKEASLKNLQGLNLEDELSKIDGELGSKTEKRNSMESELQKTRSDIINQSKIKSNELSSSANDAIKKIESEIDIERRKVTKRYDDILKEFDKNVADFVATIAELNTKDGILTTKMQNLEFRKKDYAIDSDLVECPTCHQSINEDTIKELQSKIDKIDEELDETKSSWEDVLQEIHKIDEKIKVLRIEQNKFSSELQTELNELDETYEEKIKSVNERLTAKLTQLNDLVQNSIKDATQSNIAEGITLNGVIDELKQKRIDLIHQIDEKHKITTQISDIQLSISKLNNLIETTEESEYDESIIDSIKHKDIELHAEVDKLSQLKSSYELRLEILDFWYDGFSSSGIQSMLIDDSIPFMNERIAEYMDKLSNGRYIVTFDTMKATKAGEFRDKISVEVFDNQTHADTRTKISGGQERIVDIGTILTLSDLQSNIQDIDFNILLFDEIFDSLDDENVGLVSNLIRRVAKDKWIGVISHRHIDQIEADEILSFR